MFLVKGMRHRKQCFMSRYKWQTLVCLVECHHELCSVNKMVRIIRTLSGLTYAARCNVVVMMAVEVVG